MQLWIGTSGYVYPEWVGRFYPAGTTSKEMLPCYAEHFPLVELNFSYYKVPSERELARMARRVPDGFQFIVKAHGSLTHERHLDEADAFRAGLQLLQEKGQLLAVLCQFPEQFRLSDANRAWVETLQERLAGAAVAVEFRHCSWDRPEVVAWLSERGLHLVSVDVPDIATLYPRGLRQSSRLIYLRLHSRKTEAWYGEGHDRYDYHFSDDELLEWLRALAAQAEQADRALVLFNNCRRAQAIANAKRLQALLAHLDHHFHIVPPFPSTEQQGRLF